jgi:DNA-binding CsgD family transcriptional regulator
MRMRAGSSGIRTSSAANIFPREMECLIWAAKGKSAWATATILGISDTMVKFHLGNVCHKLKVASLRQAIALLNGAQTR